MGAVPAEHAGAGSAVNDATRLFGGTLGVGIIGSVAASLYGSRLVATLPARLPAQAVIAAKGSVGGALVASHALAGLGLASGAHRLSNAAVSAFLYSQRGSCLVAAGVVFIGAVLAAALLPARPRSTPIPQQALVPEEMVP